MRLWEMLMRDAKDVEHKANSGGVLAPTDIKRVKFIKINPRYMHELRVEEVKLLKERDMPPFLRIEEQGETFFGIPLRVDRKIEKWEVVI